MVSQFDKSLMRCELLSYEAWIPFPVSSLNLKPVRSVKNTRMYSWKPLAFVYECQKGISRYKNECFDFKPVSRMYTGEKAGSIKSHFSVVSK